MAYITYKFSTFLVTLDEETEQDRIDEIEAANEYTEKFDTTVEDADLIANHDPTVEIVDGELVVTPNGDNE